MSRQKQNEEFQGDIRISGETQMNGDDRVEMMLQQELMVAGLGFLLANPLMELSPDERRYIYLMIRRFRMTPSGEVTSLRERDWFNTTKSIRERRLGFGFSSSSGDEEMASGSRMKLISLENFQSGSYDDQYQDSQFGNGILCSRF